MEAPPKKTQSPAGQPFRSHPSVWQMLDSLEQTRGRMPSTEGPSGSLEPLGVVGLASLLAEQATPEEEEAWADECASTPAAQALWQQLQTWHQQKEGLPQDRAALLSRGAEIAAEMPALPSDFWSEKGSLQADEQSTAIIESDVEIIHPTGEGLDIPLGTPEEPALVSNDTRSLWLQHPPVWATLGATFGVLGLFLVLWGPGLWRWASVELHPSERPGQKVRGIPLAPAHTFSKGSERHALHFSLFTRRGHRITKVKTSRKARIGEQLRFLYRYTPAPSVPKQSLFLLLFMIDQQGKLSPLYPASPRGIFHLRPTPRAFLPTGAVLEQLDGPERIYVCVSTRHLPYQELRVFLQGSLQRRSIRLVRRLPASCIYQRTWLLEPELPTYRK